MPSSALDAFENLHKKNPVLAKGLIYQAAAEKSLVEFIRLMWGYVEPSRPYIHNWHIDAIAEHLEAVHHGEIRKLLINVPPGFMKSLLSNVFFPAWQWIHKPQHRYIGYSYSQALTERDNIRFKQIIESDLYRQLWGDRYGMAKDKNTIIQVGNDKLGWKLASSVGSAVTGFRADTLVCDDLNSVTEAESKAVRDSTNTWFNESLPTRINSPKDSSMIVIQQRTNEDDVSGNILANGSDEWVHLMLPMHFDPDRKCITSIGWEDPREEAGDLIWPEVYGEREVNKLSSQMGVYAVSGQFEQSPAPRGGGIIKAAWWKLYPKQGEVFDEYGQPVRPLEFPEMDFIIGSVDGAFGEGQENDYSAMTVFGVYREDSQPKVMLMYAWQKRYRFHGIVPERRKGESEKVYLDRDEWGLVERVAYTCHRLNVDRLLIENKASGISLGQEIRRLYLNENFGVELINPKGDKIARAHSVSHLFENGVVSAPNREWATLAIEETSRFPKGKDDIPDTIFQSLIWLRKTGWALRTNEHEEEISPKEYKKSQGPLYDV